MKDETLQPSYLIRKAHFNQVVDILPFLLLVTAKIATITTIDAATTITATITIATAITTFKVQIQKALPKASLKNSSSSSFLFDLH